MAACTGTRAFVHPASEPQVVVLMPIERDLLPFARRGRHGLGAYVYDDLRIIEATWRLAEAQAEWADPRDK